MKATTKAGGSTQQSLLLALLRNKGGLTIEALAQSLGISRNAVRQHLTYLERDSLVARGRTQSSGGRPEQLYILTNDGNERFPRQYSWFSELLLQMLQAEIGRAALGEKLAELGRSIGVSMKPRLSDESSSAGRVESIASIMQEIGYDAVAKVAGGDQFIEAHNCVFHKLATKCPEVCNFDIALLSTCSGSQVEHRTCMVRGGDACRFHFIPEQPPVAAKIA